jgi:tRNA A37 methylthiotransferase MiaB
MRFRFTSPHPKDFPDDLLQLIAERPNIMKNVHMPAQSGSSAVLKSMRRGYTREAYLDLIHHIRTHVPDVSISSDFITGFCGETEDDHEATVSLIDQVKFDQVLGCVGSVAVG